MLAEIEEYKDEVNPMRAFVKDAIVADKNWLVPNPYLYQVYKSYIKGKGGVAIKEQKFFGTLKEELGYGPQFACIYRKRNRLALYT